MSSYTTIIAAIDDAIANWVGKPLTLSVSGRSVTYRTLESLITARKYYAALASPSGIVKVSRIRAGGAE
jgi:hypothetical protein